MTMRVRVFQHVPFEGLGSIQAWLAQKQAVVQYTRFYESPNLSDSQDLDLLIVMGGPMSVNDEAVLPWLAAEKRFIAAAIQAGKPVLGVCLGAQLIARATGARVFPGPEREIGWFDITRVDPGADSFVFPALVKVFHWHGETFDLPQGALRLACSAGCENQAFQLGERVIGLQFHLETTPQSADAMILNGRDELTAGKYVQPEALLRQAPADEYAQTNRLMADVLDYLTRP